MKRLPIDPRGAILLLIAANIVAFVQQSIYIEIAFIVFLCVILLLCDCRRAVIKWAIAYVGAICLQYILYPLGLGIFMSIYSVMFVYFRKMIPCLLVGTLLVKRFKLSYIKRALELFKIPQSIVIPILITVRYIPSIIEERQHIKNAMLIRNIKGVQRIEYTMMPLIMSAISTSEELSAAAVTRGIENPCPKTCIINIKMRWTDYFMLFVSLLFIVASVLSRGDII